LDLNKKLHIAWKRIKNDRRTDFIIGDFEYHIFDTFKNELINDLEEKILKDGTEYNPKPLRIIRVPKTSYTTRPGVVPEIDDRIYYQYLVDELAEEIEDMLVPISENVVHSYRYCKKRDSNDMFVNKSASYNTFVESTKLLSENCEYIVATDISSYFERIYHHELESTIRGLGASSEIIDKLMALLRKWRKGNSYSIPQGIWPSDYLGNIYLDPIDKFMLRKGFQYCRFVDDIRIGVNSYHDAHHVLLLLEEKLSTIGLTLNDAKTKIIPSDETEDTLFPHKQRIEEIKSEINWSKIIDSSFNPYDDDIDFEEVEKDDDEEDVDLTSARELFREQLELDHPTPSTTRFCLKHLKNFNDQEILEDVLNNFDKLVVVTPQVVSYINSIYRSSDTWDRLDISEKVASFFTEAINYDWQAMWFLQLMNKFNDIGADEISTIRDLILNQDRELHDAVLVNGLLVIGKHGDNADMDWILSLFDKNYSLWVKQTIIFSLRNLTKPKRNHFYSYCVGQSTQIDSVIKYVKQKY
jgi:hypothetical protein